MAKLKKPDYRKELETAAKQMILIRRSDTLIKLILRTIIRNLDVSHVGFLLFDKSREVYVAKFSRGHGHAKIPQGLVKVSKDNSLIKYFTNKEFRVLGSDYLLLSDINKYIQSKKRKPLELRALLDKVSFQLSLYNTTACIPGFFREDLVCMLFLGAKTDTKQFTTEELGFLSVLSSDVVMAIQNAWYFQDLEHQLERNKKLFLQTVIALASAIEAKDRYTSGHTERVSRYSLMVAQEVRKSKRYSNEQWDKFIENLKISSLLHDIGKIGIKETVLNKNGQLDDIEREEIEMHTLIGYSILCQVDELKEAMLGVKYHHERYDGKGYPEGLKGSNVPLIAQIIGIADVFDALTTDRPYRKALTFEEGAKYIFDNRGKHFPPAIVDAFLRAYKKGKLA